MKTRIFSAFAFVVLVATILLANGMLADTTEPPATPSINAAYYEDDTVFESDGTVIKIWCARLGCDRPDKTAAKAH